MKTISVSPRARSVNALLEQAVEGHLILRTADGREFLLAELDDFGHEVERTRRNQELMQLLDERGKEPATVSMSALKDRLGIR